ncbi:MAG: ornithine carbamoyltransferase [Kiritimatiellae bacterium]|nr:ornithine carbamoyltransferase [Kiritimatiellia bacterium]
MEHSKVRWKPNLKGRSLLTLHDLSDKEMLWLLDFAARLKRKKKRGQRGNLLKRKIIALIFEKMSTRTRCAAVVAAADEGGRTEYLASDEIHLGTKESVADTARVLGRMFDGILFRGYSQQRLEQLAKWAGVPVWNGLTDEAHPLQTLADLLTIQEGFGRLRGLQLVYVGDGRNNVATSLMLGCAKSGVNFVACSPAPLLPPADLVQTASKIAKDHGATVTLLQDPLSAVKNANVVYTDVWVSMGEEDKLEERMRLLKPYQVNMELMRATGNLERGRVIFLHCLPALHDDSTEMTRSTGALEVTNDVFEAEFSRVFDQAENRVHTMTPPPPPPPPHRIATKRLPTSWEVGHARPEINNVGRFPATGK